MGHFGVTSYEMTSNDTAQNVLKYMVILCIIAIFDMLKYDILKTVQDFQSNNKKADQDSNPRSAFTIQNRKIPLVHLTIRAILV